MILTTHRKHILVVILTGILAVAMAAAIMALVRTMEFFPDNRFDSEMFVQYDLTGLKVQGSTESVITGLPAHLITFTFADTDGSYDQDAASTQGLSILGDAVEQQIEQQPAIYNIEAKSDGLKDVLFDFTSVSPSDYMDDTYRNAYTAFAGIANNRSFSKIHFSSNVAGSGQRLVVIDATTTTSTTSGSMLESQWDTLVKDLPVTPLTTYKVTLNTENGSSATGTFTSQEELDALLNIDVLVWNNLIAYIPEGRNSGSQYNVVSGTLYLSPLAGSNQTTIALTVAEGTDKATYGTTFRDLAIADPDVALPYGVTTTLTVQGEESPFHVEYPSNRDW